MRDLLMTVAAMAVFQNVLLTQGFGLSLMLRTSRRGRDIWLFGLPLTGFALATVAISHPIDGWLLERYFENARALMWSRPLYLVGIAAVLYILTATALRLLLPGAYEKVGRALPLAAFNNLTIGMALFASQNVNTPLLTTLAMTLGACLGFLLLNWLLLEGRLRMDNPQLPGAFRGMPVSLLYLGMIALALMGFK